jgi:hypothetical protein
MSWQDIMQRVLPPMGGVSPHLTSAYGVLRKKGPHGGVDFNYLGGQQAEINLSHPALRAPVSGVVTTNPGKGDVGMIAIRDKNGLSHEILHTHTQFLTAGDPVVAGQLIGTMGNTGTQDHHVHYQLKDPAGNILNPTAFWDQQRPVDPNPAPPALVPEYQRYLQHLGVTAGDRFGNAPDVAGPPAAPLVQPHEVPSDRSEFPGARFGNWASGQAAVPPLVPADRPESFDNRYGNWGSVPAGSFGDTDSALLRALEKYRSSATPGDTPSMAAMPSPSNADNSPPYAFDPTKPPPPFTPSNYASAYRNIDKWIASLAGVEPGDPTEFLPPPIFSPLYRR